MTDQPDLEALAAKVINDEGGLPGHSIHSWRCEDNDRYPEPCTCVEDVAKEVLAAVLPAHERMVRERLAAEIRDGLDGWFELHACLPPMQEWVADRITRGQG